MEVLRQCYGLKQLKNALGIVENNPPFSTKEQLRLKKWRCQIMQVYDLMPERKYVKNI